MPYDFRFLAIALTTIRPKHTFKGTGVILLPLRIQIIAASCRTRICAAQRAHGQKVRKTIKVMLTLTIVFADREGGERDLTKTMSSLSGWDFVMCLRTGH